jgi:DNA-binding winged helix-turn-helix (wHTH) protein/TolB-like protein
MQPSSGLLQIGDWHADSSSGVLQRGDATVRLEPRVMAVLLDLAKHPGEVRTKDAIIGAVWEDTYVGEAALSRCISELRRALGDDARKPRYIETLPKRGYRLVAEVRHVASDIESPSGHAGPEPRRPLWQTILAAVIVASMFVLWWRGMPTADDGTIETIAVLPLRALSDDGQQRFFAEGLTEQLIANLATIDSVRVVSGRSARLARDAAASPAEIADALGVDAVVDGTVQRSADRTLVSLELIQAPGERLIWGGSYQERGDDGIEIQQEVAAQATREIALALAALGSAPVRRPVDAAARRALERGQLLATRGNPIDAIRSLEHFRQALEIDSDYALAWALLGDMHATLAWRNWSTTSSAYAEARAAAHMALDLDPALPEAHAVLAAVAAERNQDWPEAERRFKTAVELRPPSAFALERYGRYLRRMGRAAEAVEQTAAALLLAPDSSPIAVSHGWNLILAGDLAAAQQTLDSVLEVDGNFADAYAGICAIANLERRYAEARGSCGLAAAMPGHELALGPRAFAEGRDGDVAAARATLEEIGQLDPAAAALARATAYLGLGDSGAAIAALVQAETQRAIWLPALLGNPYLLELRTAPRVARILDDLLIVHSAE